MAEDGFNGKGRGWWTATRRGGRLHRDGVVADALPEDDVLGELEAVKHVALRRGDSGRSFNQPWLSGGGTAQRTILDQLR